MSGFLNNLLRFKSYIVPCWGVSYTYLGLYLYIKVLISVCLLFFCPIITQEPLDRFATIFNWGTRRDPRECSFLGFNYVYFGQRRVPKLVIYIYKLSRVLPSAMSVSLNLTRKPSLGVQLGIHLVNLYIVLSGLNICLIRYITYCTYCTYCT